MSNFTLDSLRADLTDFYDKSGDRQLVVMTGKKGMDRFDLALKQAAASMLSDGLKEDNMINEEEYTNLNTMIYSSDQENLIVAMAIMNQIRK